MTDSPIGLRPASLASRLNPLHSRSAEAHGEPWDLWVWSDGASARKVSSIGEDAMYPAWSPDGERLAVVTDIALYTLAADGTDLKVIDTLAEGRGLAWLPEQTAAP